MADPKPDIRRALTKKSLLLGLPLLLLWICLVSWALPHDGLLQQQLILLAGFGALFSLFFLKFLVDFLPARLRPSGAEMTFVYALLLCGIPAAVMGRLALESAMANHVMQSVVSGPRGFIPISGRPDPHIGPAPRLDPPDVRCPYLELPPYENGAPRRPPLAAPPVEESARQIQAALAACDKYPTGQP